MTISRALQNRIIIHLFVEKYHPFNLSSKSIASKYIKYFIYVSYTEKNDFAELSKNLASYKSENNFCWIKKLIKN